MKKSFPTYPLVIVALAIVFGLCYWMASKVERKVAITIDGIEIANAQSITAGKNSGICFHQVPHDYIEITQCGESFRWEINSIYQDSLQYYKVNNINPNKHAVRNDSQQKISITLPPYAVNTQDTVRLSLTGAEVWTLWNTFKKQKDVLIRWFAIKHQLERAGCSDSDSLKWLAHLQNNGVRSFFHKTGNQIDLVILDRYTTIDDTIRYARNGQTSTLADTARHCKLQFFAIGDYCYRDEEPEEGYFHINGVNYVMKPYVKTTEWGAGHAMITSTNSGLRVSYPRPITFVASVDSLRALSNHSSGIITLKQNNSAVPAKGDLYLPEFSNAINFDLCNVEFFHQDDSITLRDNNYQVSTIRNPRALVPAFSKVTLRSGEDKLFVRTGFINRSFVNSYLLLPLIVWAILVVFIWLPISPFKIPYSYLADYYNTDQIRKYPVYLTVLITTCLAYCCCKSLIALKLSYTYPYFEKLTGIIPMSTSLMMLLLFSLAMILNTHLLHIRNTWHRWSGGIICAIILGFLYYVFFGMMDSQISDGMLQSYLQSETGFSSFKQWFESGAIQDTHRSVVYALFAVETIALLFWLVLNLIWKRIESLAELVQNGRPWWITLFIHIGILAIIFLVGKILGNFSTAIITFLVIIGLCDALSQFTNRLNKGGSMHIGLLLSGMFVVTIVYIIAAFLSDFGYMTNYIGFFLFFLFTFWIVKRPETTHDRKAYESLKTENRWVYGLLSVFALIAMMLTFICHWYFDTEKVNYTRYARRIMLFTDFSDLKKSGYRYNESDAEFMVIMSHYMQNSDSHDPLSNDSHALHPSISTGQSPVVLNDLSVPVAFIGSYGWMATIVFFGLLAILAWLVMRYCMEHIVDEAYLTTAMQWRILALFMWVSTSIYIYLSYHSWLPFTGRLNPGFGVDAVGEALETAILLAFMASITCKKRI